MSVNLNELAAELTLMEGLEDSQNIASMKEVIAVLGLRWRAMPYEAAFAEFEAIRDRAGTFSAHD